jgi:hypothetical protein
MGEPRRAVRRAGVHSKRQCQWAAMFCAADAQNSAQTRRPPRIAPFALCTGLRPTCECFVSSDLSEDEAQTSPILEAPLGIENALERANYVRHEHLFNGQGGGLSRCWRQDASAPRPRRPPQAGTRTVRASGLFQAMLQLPQEVERSVGGGFPELILGHTIALDPTPDRECHFRRACGTARYAYNCGLAEWQRMHTAGERPSMQLSSSAGMRITKRSCRG